MWKNHGYTVERSFTSSPSVAFVFEAGNLFVIVLMCLPRLKAVCESVHPSLSPSCKVLFIIIMTNKGNIQQVVTILIEGSKVKTMRCKMVSTGNESRRICRKVPIKVCNQEPCRRRCPNPSGARQMECGYKPKKVCQRMEGEACRTGQEIP